MTSQDNIRQFSPYELSQLKKYGFTPAQLKSQGEMPVEYLTGHVTFIDWDFLVSPAVLIPRVETEELVHLATDAALTLFKKQVGKPMRFIDIGTGSGAIGISLGLALQQRGVPFQAWLTDISAAALAIAQQNLQRLAPQLQNAFTISQSDLLAQVPRGQTFSLVVANLPYIPQAQLAALPLSVKNFEPSLALDGGEDGLQQIRRLLSSITPYLDQQFEIWLEIDDTHQLSAIQNLVPHWHVALIPDSFGKMRFACITPTNVS